MLQAISLNIFRFQDKRGFGLIGAPGDTLLVNHHYWDLVSFPHFNYSFYELNILGCYFGLINKAILFIKDILFIKVVLKV